MKFIANNLTGRKTSTTSKTASKTASNNRLSLQMASSMTSLIRSEAGIRGSLNNISLHPGRGSKTNSRSLLNLFSTFNSSTPSSGTSSTGNTTTTTNNPNFQHHGLRQGILTEKIGSCVTFWVYLNLYELFGLNFSKILNFSLQPLLRYSNFISLGICFNVVSKKVWLRNIKTGLENQILIYLFYTLYRLIHNTKLQFRIFLLDIFSWG